MKMARRFPEEPNWVTKRLVDDDGKVRNHSHPKRKKNPPPILGRKGLFAFSISSTPPHLEKTYREKKKDF